MNIILAISLVLASIFVPKIRLIAEGGSASTTALFATESALEWCLYASRGKPPMPQPVMDNGATYTIVPGDCAIGPLNHRITGTYRGVSRAFEITTEE